MHTHAHLELYSNLVNKYLIIRNGLLLKYLEGNLFREYSDGSMLWVLSRETSCWTNQAIDLKLGLLSTHCLCLL